MTHTDGNLLAGPLHAILGVDLTTAQGTCDGCGTRGPIASALVYGPEPGLVARCPSCENVLLRIVQTADRAWLDLRGLTSIEVALA
ncbi:MAG: hypothetical protein QOD41_2320 [Cryptosporangiaceae bacterium]|nr:hypothetical protein [Cryptosporangiaceae bacterium]